MISPVIPEEMLASGIRLVARTARAFRSGGLDREELVAEGRLGLVRAFLRYDPRRGTRFSTCALPWIRKEMIGALGRPPSRDETSRAPARPVRDIDRVLLTEVRVVPLEAPAGERDGLPLLDRLADPRAATPEELLGREPSRRLIRGALARLTPLEQRLLARRDSARPARETSPFGHRALTAPTP